VPRKASGSVVFREGKNGAPGTWVARVTCIDGSRPWVPLKGQWPNTKQGWARAKEAAAGMAERMRERGIVAVPQRGPKARALHEQEVAGWWGRWFTYRASLGLRDVKGVYQLHVTKVVGAKDIAEATPEDSRKLRSYLDGQVESKRMSWKTAFNVWTIWTTACKAACGNWSKDKDGARFKVRNDNPAANISPPDRGDPKQLQFLYPDEFLTLVSCKDVPLVWRRIYACAAYLFVRAGELRALRWEDIDLAHGVVSIRYSFDQESRQVKQTKTGNKGLRRFGIEPELLPLLRAMHDETGGRGVPFTMPDRKHWADGLRQHLLAAGVKRPELFLNDATNKQIRFHDLRGTGLTWMALRGDEPLKIQARAGHRTFAMTDKYIRLAEQLPGETFGKPFPTLPKCLLEPDASGQSPEPRGRFDAPAPDAISSEGIVLAELSARNFSGGAGNRTPVDDPAITQAGRVLESQAREIVGGGRFRPVPRCSVWFRRWVQDPWQPDGNQAPCLGHNPTRLGPAAAHWCGRFDVRCWARGLQEATGSCRPWLFLKSEPFLAARAAAHAALWRVSRRRGAPGPVGLGLHVAGSSRIQTHGAWLPRAGPPDPLATRVRTESIPTTTR
jgi:integrase